MNKIRDPDRTRAPPRKSPPAASRAGGPSPRGRRASSRRSACGPSTPAASTGSHRTARHGFRSCGAACAIASPASPLGDRSGGSTRSLARPSWRCRPGCGRRSHRVAPSSDFAAFSMIQVQSRAPSGARAQRATVASWAYSLIIRSSSTARVRSQGTSSGAGTARSGSLSSPTWQHTTSRTSVLGSRSALTTREKSDGSRRSRTHRVPPPAALNAVKQSPTVLARGSRSGSAWSCTMRSRSSQA